MAHLVDARSMASRATLTDKQKSKGARTLARKQAHNPLRRVSLQCCGWVRDPVGVIGDHIWCDTHADFARVVDVAE